MSVIAIGSGKGGVGRTLVASGLAVFLAQLGKRVLLVDGQPGAAVLPSLFGIPQADGTRPPWAPPVADPRGVPSEVPNVSVLSATSEMGSVAGIPLRRPREIAANGGTDLCILDVGPGVSHGVLDAMLDADSMVVVTAPEPLAVEAFHRFVRHAYVRALEHAFHGHPPEQDTVRASAREAVGAPVPLRLAERLQTVSVFGAETAWRTLARLRVRLVVNSTRSRADLDLGDTLAVIAQQRLGVGVDYLGHVEYDDAVVLAAKHRKPLLVEAPAARASRNLERIARRLVAVESGRSDRAAAVANPGPPAPATHYEVLALDRGASDEEIRRAYRRLREAYSPESIAISGLLAPAEMATVIARIEEARDVLLDSTRRRPYDLSITAPDDLRAYVERSTRAAVPAVEHDLVVMPDLNPDTEFTGELLRAIRESRGIELRDIAARTKISPHYLKAIEDEDFSHLPALVYTRGFVVEIAKFHRLDIEQVIRTYLRRFRRATENAE